MFEFEAKLRAADPAATDESSMPDFGEMARRIHDRAPSKMKSSQISQRIKIGTGAMALAILMAATLASFVSTSAPASRSARRAYWNLPTAELLTGPVTGFISGNNFQFLASPSLSRSSVHGSLFEVKSGVKPLVQFAAIAHAFGVSTTTGVSSIAQPKQIELTAGDSSSSTGSLTYWSYQGSNSAQYAFNKFHFASNDADKLLFSDQNSTQISGSDQRSYLATAQASWSALKSSVALDGASATWQIVTATTSSGSTESIVRLSIPVVVQGYKFGQAATFEFTSNGRLISVDGPDVDISKIVSLTFQSPMIGVKNLNSGINAPCGSTNIVGTARSTRFANGATTPLEQVAIENSSLVYVAQRTSNKSIWLIPFFEYSGQMGHVGISGFLGTSAIDSKHLSITKSSNGTCVSKLLVR